MYEKTSPTGYGLQLETVNVLWRMISLPGTDGVVDVAETGVTTALAAAA